MVLEKERNFQQILNNILHKNMYECCFELFRIELSVKKRSVLTYFENTLQENLDH